MLWLVDEQVGGPPDIILAADCVYETQFHEALLTSLKRLMAPHTLAFVAYRKRTVREQQFAPTAMVGGLAHAHTHTSCTCTHSSTHKAECNTS